MGDEYKSIFLEAEIEDTAEAYKQMYKRFANMSHEEALAILYDAKCMLETKLLLKMDNQGIDSNKLSVLAQLAEEIGEIKVTDGNITKARKDYDFLTSK